MDVDPSMAEFIGVNTEEMIIKDGESAESIIDIVDCINNDTEEFKKAYECINDESGILGKVVKELKTVMDTWV